MCVGAGTVLKSSQAEQAKDAGAEFLVAPGLNPKTVRHAQELEIPIIPGVNSPSQVEQALDLDLQFLKFFPAEPSGGTSMVKFLLLPYLEICLMPSGGINLENVDEYLSIDRVICCGGSWLAPKELISSQRWDLIGENVRAIARR